MLKTLIGVSIHANFLAKTRFKQILHEKIKIYRIYEVKVMKNEKIIENVDEITGLLREKAAAEYLGISYENLKRSVRYRGLISYVKFRKGIRYRKADLDAYINKHRVSATI